MELPGFSETSIPLEPQTGHVAAQENPVIDVVEYGIGNLDFFEDGLAERMKGSQRDVAAALACGSDDARIHFAGGFAREGEPEDVFTAQRWIGLQQVADALSNDAGLAGSGAVQDGAPLSVIDLEPTVIDRRMKIEQSKVHRNRLADFEAKRKRSRLAIGCA
jgi:hypothetical protein